MEQSWKRKSIKRSKRSDGTSQESQTREPISIFQEINRAGDQAKKQNLEDLLKKLKKYYSTDLKIGAALKTGDCFFDAVAQGLNELNIKPVYRFTAKSLRKDCADYAERHGKQNSWIYKAVIKDAGAGGYFAALEGPHGPIQDPQTEMNIIDEENTFNKYLRNVKTVAIEADSPPIWGRLDVEGRMICEKYEIKIELIELLEKSIEESTENRYVIQSEQGEGDKVVRIVTYKQHFVPLLGNLAADVTEDVKVSREEIYGEEASRDTSLMEDIGNFDFEESSNLHNDQAQLHINKIDTKGDGNCFFHAVFGDEVAGRYEAKKAVEMRGKWREFLLQFESLNDPKMSKPLKEQLEKLFNLFLNNPEHLTGRSKTIKNLAEGTKKKMEIADNEANQLKESIGRKFSINENTIASDLKRYALLNDPNLTADGYDKKYNSEIIANKSFLGTTELYKAYLEAINNQKYFVFFEEIPVLASLANIKITVYHNNGNRFEVFEPKQELLGSYQSDRTIWGQKKEAVIYHQGNHFSYATIQQPSQRSPYDDSQSDRGNQPVDSAQHHEINLSSPDSTDDDDEATPEEELLITIKCNDSEEEKCEKIRRLFQRERKPEVNFRYTNNKSETVLHIAVRKGECKVIDLLIEKGAKINDDSVKNDKGRTPLAIAKQRKRENVMQMLELRIQRSQRATVKEQPSTPRKRTRTDSEEDKSEKSDFIKPRISRPDYQPMEVVQDMSSKKRTHSNEGGDNDAVKGQRQRISILDRRNEYSASGVKSSLHGIAYQLKLLMLFLKRGVDQRYSFRLATEMDAAEKFDDLVFQYENETKDGIVYRFLQAKHKQDESKKISVNDLLTEKDEEFSLQKYFVSYSKIKQNSEFNGTNDEIKDLVICTNIDFSDNLQNSFERMVDEDNLIDIEVKDGGKEPKRLKFKKSGFPIKERLSSVLQEASDLKRLAKKLAYHVFSINDNDKTIDLKDELFKKYHGALAEKVIDIETKKFKIDFINESSNLFEEVKKFRKVLLEKSKLSNDNFKRELQTKNLKISDAFGNVLKLKEIPEITKKEKTLSRKTSDSIQEFAQKIVDSISEKKPNEIVSIEQRAHIIKENIAKLAGHVFIKTEEDIIKFRRGFLDGDKLPGNLNDFREALKTMLPSTNKGILFSHLGQYQFKINIDTCTEEDYEEYKKDKSYFECLHRLPNDEVDPKEIDDFLDKLVFAVNQPDEVKLGEIIEDEMGEDKDINLIDCEFMASKLQKYMLDWMKEKKGRFLTHEDGKSLFKEVKQKISKLILIGPTLEYHAKIENFGIAFKEGPLGLSDFLYSSKKQIFNLVTLHKTILSSIKVYQTLRNRDKYQKDDSHIFLRSSSLLRIQDHVMKTFESRMSNLLVIECKAAEENVDNLYSQLSKIIKLNSDKKIILITQENDPLASKFEDYFSGGGRYEKKKDEKNSLTDLTDDSQQKLLEKQKFVFQGKEVSLGTLVGDGSKSLIDGEVLSKLINDEMIEIGEASTDSKYEDVRDYYIDRTFNRQVKIKRELKEKSKFIIVTGSGEVNEQQLKKDQDIVVISDTDVRFSELLIKNEERNIHWLKEEGNEYVWQRSRGDLSKLRAFVDKNEQTIQEYKPETITDITDRVVIISAEPGMGKSTILTYLAVETKKSNPSLWVIRINLLNYSTELKRKIEGKTTFNEIEAIKFLYKTLGFQLCQKKQAKAEERERMIENVLRVITVKNGEISLEGYEKKIQGLNLLEMGLFKNFYNQGRIALLFDGFDEISPDYEEKVIELLQVFKNTKVEKIWITTRPYNIIQEKLEDKLSVFSDSLKPLLPEEQKEYLRKFWKAKLKFSELDEQRSEVFIDELLLKFSKLIHSQNFMSIPLHAFMVAEVGWKYGSVEQELSDEQKRKIDKLDLVSLYEEFIVIKFYEIQIREKRPTINIDDQYIKSVFDKEYMSFIENHKKLAVYAIFEEDKAEQLLSDEEKKEVSELIDKIERGNEKIGIIERVIDNRPKFIHQTFAEYFAASYFWEKCKTIQFDKFNGDFVKNIIIDNLIEDDRIQISEFFQLKAKKDLEGNVDFSDQEDKLKTLLIRLVDQTLVYDPFGKNKQSTKILFGIIEFYLLIEEGSYLKLIENIKDSNQQLKLLCVCAEMGYIKLANSLGEKLDAEFLQKYLEQHKWKYSPLWLAAENGHLDVVRILVNKLSYDTSWKDTDNMTLVSRIFERNAFSVLRSCLKLDIVDGKPYEGSLNQELPIVEALNKGAPSDVIKLLIEKSNIDLVNKFDYLDGLNAGMIMSIELLKYDKGITELAIKKGIDFSEVINSLLHDFNYESLNSPIHRLRGPHQPKSSDHSDQAFLNLFERVELFLKCGVGYNCKDTEYGTTTLQYAEKIHYIHKLLDRVHKIHNQKDDKSSSPLGPILKLIIDIVSSSPDFIGYEIIIDSNKISLLLNYKHKSLERDEKISLLPADMPKLFSKCHEDSNTNLVQSTLGKLRSYISDAEEEIERFKTYPDRKTYDHIFDGYEEMFKLSPFNNREEKERRYESLNEFEKDLLARVFVLYRRQDYEIDDALKEVSEEVSKFEKVINRLKEIYENSGRQKNVYETDEILYVLDIKSIDPNKELQDVISKIYECGGIKLLYEAWSNLHCIGQKRVMGILELMFKFSDQSSKIFELLKELDRTYKIYLIVAIKNKNYGEINNILQKVEPADFRKAIINGQDDNYGSPLHYAACKGDVETTRILLTSGANPNLKLKADGELLLSTVNPAEETEEDEDCSPKNYEYCTPLHLAVYNRHPEVVEILLSEGADINAEAKGAGKILRYAVQTGKLDVVKFLVEKDTYINAKDKNDRTPLHYAAEGGKLYVVEFLVGKDADVNAEDIHGRTPLNDAAESGKWDVVEFLVENDADINTIDQCRRTVLHHAAESGKLDVVKNLVEKGTYIDAEDKDGWTPLHYAARSGKLDVVQFLVELGTDINAEDTEGWTPLHCAARSGKLDVVEFLVELGTDINAEDTDGWTPLHCAARSGELDVVQFFVEKSTDINAKVKDGWTTLHCAARSGSLDVVQFFVELGTDINAKDEDGWTPLHYAAENGKLDIVEFLVGKDADINAEDNYDRTPLHDAA